RIGPAWQVLKPDARERMPHTPNHPQSIVLAIAEQNRGLIRLCVISVFGQERNSQIWSLVRTDIYPDSVRELPPFQALLAFFTVRNGGLFLTQIPPDAYPP
ncbi:MAG: hypothetical protein P8Y52_14600, partial [Xanthomonadales bacterium]